MISVKCYYNKNYIKTVNLVVGNKYRVEPVNPQNKKFKGEIVELKEIDSKNNVRILRLESNWHVKRNHLIEFSACDLTEI